MKCFFFFNHSWFIKYNVMVIMIRSCEAVLFSHATIGIVCDESKAISHLHGLENLHAVGKVKYVHISFS